MALRGSLQDMGLADILQLIFKTKKVGLLRLVNDADEVWANVMQGWIVDADHEGRPSDAKLANRLVRAGLLSTAELGIALKQRADTGDPIADILMTCGYADLDTITKYATLQATDTIFEVFTWRNGRYEFEERPVPPPPPWIQPISGDQLLLQGLRIHNEWPKIAQLVPSGDYRIVARRPLPPEPELSPDLLFSNAQLEEDELDANQRVIHELAQPSMNVQMVIDRSPFHRLETCRCLSRLVDVGYLALSPP